MNKLKNFPYSHVLVLGLAKSGTAAAKLLLKNHINVRINDFKTNQNDKKVQDLIEMGADVIVGSHPLSVLDGIELIVKNPGIPYDNIILKEAKKRKIPIITEVEIAGKIVENPVIAITGSNGKTTTTMLIAEMLRKSNHHVKTAGNIGVVSTEVAETLNKDEKMILELSSFQLLGVPTFRPHVAVLLNVYEAHLDYHKTLENYKQAKFNIFTNQTENDYLIYNIEDETVVKGVECASSKLIPFSTKRRLVNGVWTSDNSVYFKHEKIIDKSKIVLVGEHNLENILAAVGAAKVSGATIDGIREVLQSFSGVKHRLEFVRNINQRLFYNDSKATNILATQKALSSFNQPTILLAGGLDRGNEFIELLPYLHHVKAMVVFGQTAKKLEKIGNKAAIQTTIVENIDYAVRKAYSLSFPGDVILLSPACASWDQYRTFEERGDMFINAVHTLA